MFPKTGQNKRERQPACRICVSMIMMTMMTMFVISHGGYDNEKKITCDLVFEKNSSILDFYQSRF